MRKRVRSWYQSTIPTEVLFTCSHEFVMFKEARVRLFVWKVFKSVHMSPCPSPPAHWGLSAQYCRLNFTSTERGSCSCMAVYTWTPTKIYMKNPHIQQTYLCPVWNTVAAKRWCRTLDNWRLHFYSNIAFKRHYTCCVYMMFITSKAIVNVCSFQ